MPGMVGRSNAPVKGVHTKEPVLQANCCRVAGTQAHTMNSTPAIATNLQPASTSASLLFHISIGTYAGGKALIPALEAIAPVMNGKTAAPAAPQLPAHPIAPEMQSGGRMRPAWFIRMGKMGPRKKPTNEMEIAPAKRFGTNQTTSSSLAGCEGSNRWTNGAKRGYGGDVRDDGEDIDEDNASFADLGPSAV